MQGKWAEPCVIESFGHIGKRFFAVLDQACFMARKYHADLSTETRNLKDEWLIDISPLTRLSQETIVPPCMAISPGTHLYRLSFLLHAPCPLPTSCCICKPLLLRPPGILVSPLEPSLFFPTDLLPACQLPLSLSQMCRLRYIQTPVPSGRSLFHLWSLWCLPHPRGLHAPPPAQLAAVSIEPLFFNEHCKILSKGL